MASDVDGNPDLPGLVRRAQAGDGAAFTCLVELHQERLVRFCVRLMRQHAAAQDLAQETLWRAYRALPALSQPDRFAAWLFGIAANLAKRAWRQEARRPLSLEELADEYPDVPWEALLPASPPPDQLVEEAEQEQRLLDAIASLPAPLGRVVLLHYLHGLSYAEVATALDLPVSTVRNRLFQSRARLRRQLASDFALPPPRIIARSHRGGHVQVQRGETSMVHPETEARPEFVPVVVDVVQFPQEPQMPWAVRRWLELSIYREEPDDPAPDLTALADRVMPLLREADFSLSGMPRVILRDQAGDRTLVLRIGRAEAYAIALQLQGQASPRPLTIDIAHRLLTLGGAEIVQTAVTRREPVEGAANGSTSIDGTFYATVTVRLPQGDHIEVDARPSDAIGLALRASAPMYVAASLLGPTAFAGWWQTVDPTASFTDEARGAFDRTEAEARASGHHYLGTEHLLVGIASGEGEPAARVLADAGVGLPKYREVLAETMGRGTGAAPGQLVLAPRMRVVVQEASAEARLGGQPIGSGHLLLGLLREGEGVAVELLKQRFGVDLARLEGAIRHALAPET